MLYKPLTPRTEKRFPFPDTLLEALFCKFIVYDSGCAAEIYEPHRHVRATTPPHSQPTRGKILETRRNLYVLGIPFGFTKYTNYRCSIVFADSLPQG